MPININTEFFKVIEVIEHNLIVVEKKWEFDDYTGNRVLIRGIGLNFHIKKKKSNFNFLSFFKKKEELSEPSEEVLTELRAWAKNRTKMLLLNKLVILRVHPSEVSDCIEDNSTFNDCTIKCRIYLDDVNIVAYYPDFPEQK